MFMQDGKREYKIKVIKMEDKQYADMITDDGYVMYSEEMKIKEHMPEDILARYKYLSNFEKMFEGLCFNIRGLKNACYDEICKMPEPITKKWVGHYNGERARLEPTVDLVALSKDHPELLDTVLEIDALEVSNKLLEVCPDEYDAVTIKLAEEKLGKDFVDSTKIPSIVKLREVLPYSDWEKYTKYTKTYSFGYSPKDEFVVLSRCD